MILNIIESIFIGLFVWTTIHAISRLTRLLIADEIIPATIWTIPAIMFTLFWFIHLIN